MRALIVAWASATALTGCARPPGGDGAGDPCPPVTYALESGLDVTHLVGSYALTMVATAGDSVGRTATGRLDLVPTRRDDAALVGKTDLPVGTVGALRLGRLADAEESAPGVLVLRGGEDRPTVLMRLGSDANASGAVRFDGGYAVLEVLRTDDRGFAGSWRSGVESNSATGHFCARRVTDHTS